MLANRRRRSRAFTLVELLVVIGIIALLISILLPALQSARRQAMAVKCAAQLREIGHAFQLYASDTKGWYPVAQLLPGGGKKYNVNGVDYPYAGYGAYWINFLAKYVTKNKIGLESTNSAEAIQGRNNVLWGCPSWNGYASTTIGGVNRLQNGYGMNIWPTFTASFTPKTSAPIPERAYIRDWGTAAQTGNFIKQVKWGRQGAERCLVADSIFWMVDSQYVPPATGMVGQSVLTNTNAAGSWAFATGNTLIDAYRHGKYPKPVGDGVKFETGGGKVSFNVLYADGHVDTSVDRTDAFRSVRQRYPG